LFALVLALICFIAGFFVLPYQLQVMQQSMPQQYQEIMDALPFPMIITIQLLFIPLFY
jgi:hypothetical protein